MAVGKELFSLYGKLSLLGVEPMKKELKAIDKQARKATREIDKLGRKISAVGKTLTKAFTLPLIAAGVASVKFINDASDLNETIAKTGEIFGESAKEIEAWAATSARKIGQSKTQAMDAASTFGIFGASAGLAGEDLVKFSTGFTELASDMASFFDTKPEDAIIAIGAAFRGENEPIRRYGVMLDDATLRAKAFEMGLISTTKKALMPQTKVLAAQAVIFEHTKKVQGDFARTSEGLANQKRKLNAQLQNVSASLGQLFLPMATKTVKILQRMIGFVERGVEVWKNLDASTKKTIKGFVVILAAIGPVVFAVGKLVAFGKILVPLFVALKTGTISWAGAMAALQGSVFGVVAVIGALVAIGWYWYANWDKMTAGIKSMWYKLLNVIVQNIGKIRNKVADGLLSLIDMVDKVSWAIPGLGKKLDKARVSLLLWQAENYRTMANAKILTNVVAEQGAAYGSLSDDIKGAIDKAKEMLGMDAKTAEGKKKLTQLEKERAEVAKQAWQERKAFDADIQDQLARQVSNKFELLELERQKAIEEAKAKEADVHAVRLLYFEKYKALQAEALALSEEKAAQEKEHERQAWQERINTVSGIGNKVNKILGKFHRNAMMRVDKKEKREIEAIENSAMTDEEKEKAKAATQEKFQKKREAMEKKAAIREKIAALFNIALNTAAAVVKALPNIPLSILVGGIGLAEAAAVAATPLPFEEGGLIKGSQGGVNSIIGENNTDEIVFPLEKGITLLVDKFIQKLADIQLPAVSAPEPLAAGAGAGAGSISLHIGTFIGDQRGLKELERKLYDIRIAENQRRGF